MCSLIPENKHKIPFYLSISLVNLCFCFVDYVVLAYVKRAYKEVFREVEVLLTVDNEDNT